MKNFQKIGVSFMLPIVILPIAGILLGIGGAFTSSTLIETYNLTFLQTGAPLNYILVLLFNAGNFVFSNLPLLFAVSVAIGMSNKSKETAALSAVIGFLLFHTVIGVILKFQGHTPDNTSVDSLMAASLNSEAYLYVRELGIFTLQTGIFGGIICGLLSAFITNKFSDKILPDYLAFFSGKRFAVVLTMVFFIPLAALFSFIWPSIFKLIVKAGELFASAGYIGTFFYGFATRILNIFGLHHAIYPLFWYTELGGVLEVGGKMVAGGQRIFFAQLADTSITHFSAAATRTMTGGFLPTMFGLPAAALSMYNTADNDKKIKVKVILLSAALTSFLTGITEPLEFTFLFAAPLLYTVHAALEGLAYMLMYMLNVAVGIAFSKGLIDFTFFGLMQGIGKTSYQWILIFGPVYFLIYYFLFKFLIIKFNFATLGRLGSEVKLYKIDDYSGGDSVKASNNKDLLDDDNIIDSIVNALGGIENIENIDACVTRLRVTVKDPNKVAGDNVWTSLNSKKVLRIGNVIQAVYGIKAEVYKNKIIQKYNIR